MLREFLIAHRREVIQKCREKATASFAPSEAPAALEHGVPLFIQQLINALEARPSASGDVGGPGGQTLFPAEIGRSAALNGAELLRRGFTVDQVVHHYGDVCQSITEMAIELKCGMNPDDFRILNGCLDNAIAGAVTAFAQGHQNASDDRDEERYERLSIQQQEHRRLVAIALQAFTAMRSGGLGLTGATGGLLMHALTELHWLSEQPLVAEDEAESAASLQRA